MTGCGESFFSISYLFTDKFGILKPLFSQKLENLTYLVSIQSQRIVSVVLLKCWKQYKNINSKKKKKYSITIEASAFTQQLFNNKSPCARMHIVRRLRVVNTCCLGWLRALYSPPPPHYYYTILYHSWTNQVAFALFPPDIVSAVPLLLLQCSEGV